MKPNDLQRASISSFARDRVCNSHHPMLKKLKLSQWISLIMVVITGLTVFISGLGIFTTMDIQSSLSVSSAVVQKKLETQNSRLREKSQQFQLATDISRARSSRDLENILNRCPQLVETTANRDSFTSKIGDLFAAQRQYLGLRERLVALNVQIEACLATINTGVNAVVAAIEQKTDGQASDALGMLSSHSQSQRTAVLDALKQAAQDSGSASNQLAKVSLIRDRSYMDGKVIWETLQSAGNKIKSSLNLRSDCWVISQTLTRVQSASSLAEVAKCRDSLTNLFEEAKTQLGGLDPNLTGSLLTNLATLQEQAIGVDGVVSLTSEMLLAEAHLVQASDDCHQLVQSTDLRVIAQAAQLQSESTAELGKSVARAAVNQRSLVILTSIALVIALLLTIFLVPRILNPLKQISARVSKSAREVSVAATQISSASHSLAEGASEQAASLEETSSSLEEMSSMTRRNVDTAEKVNQLGKQARVAAENGAKDMEDMRVAMELSRLPMTTSPRS